MATRMTPPRLTAAQQSQLNQAVAHHQAGRLDAAAQGYEQLLAAVPGQFDAAHLLGVIALQSGRLDEAEGRITAALASNPKDPGALNNLGTTLLRAGRLAEACAQFERVVKAQPGHADALINLGTALRTLGRVTESVAPLRKAFALNPRSAVLCGLLGASLLETGDTKGAVNALEAGTRAAPKDPVAWANLARAARAAGQAPRALEAIDQALALNPDDAQALAVRGQALDAMGRTGEAEECFRQAARRAPNEAAVMNNLGAFLREQGRLAEALPVLRRAAQLGPGLAVAQDNLVNTLLALGQRDEAARLGEDLSRRLPDSAVAQAALGSTLFEAGRLEESIAAWLRAVALPGADADMHLGLAQALMALGDADRALPHYQQALKIEPAHVRARWAAAHGHLRPIHADVRAMEAGRREYGQALTELDTWSRTLPALAARAVGAQQPFYLAYHPVPTRDLLARHGQLASRLMAAAIPAEAVRRPLPGAGSTRKLRLGIVSAQVRDHSVWNAITRGWVEHLDPARFEIVIFKLGPGEDAETARARRHAVEFEDRSRSMPEWVDAIRDARLDVLLYPEIGMDPLTTQLAAQRLAPVQAASWGHPQTTGLPTIDLYLSGEALEPAPEVAATHYTERLVRLPRLGVCVKPLRPVPVAPDLASLGLPENEPLLLCPGTPFKYHPMADEVWVGMARRLQALGRGRLVFFRSQRPFMDEQLERRLRAQFKRQGVDFERTVSVIPTLERQRFYGLMHRATLMLDTVGFSGFNTALQGLECGLPVVAWEGEYMRGRLASGPLRLLGLDAQVAGTPQAYIDAAMHLVEHEPERLALRQTILARLGQLFDDLQPVRALEATLIEAVEAARTAPAA